MKKIACLVMAALLMLMCKSVVAEIWGVKVSVTTNAVAYTVSPRATHVSFYNAGSADVAVDVNSSTSTLTTAATNNTAAVCPALLTVTVDLSPTVSSAQLNKITNVVLRAASTTQTVYVVAY